MSTPYETEGTYLEEKVTEEVESLRRLVGGRVVHEEDLLRDGVKPYDIIGGLPVYSYGNQMFMLRNIDHKLPEFFMLYMRFSEDKEGPLNPDFNGVMDDYRFPPKYYDRR